MTQTSRLFGGESNSAYLAAVCALLAISCTPQPTAPTAGTDCERFCAAVSRLRCVEGWDIEPDDDGCMRVCVLNTEQGLSCPGNALAAATCDELDERSRCDG